jgi:hypothetical protein
MLKPEQNMHNMRFLPKYDLGLEDTINDNLDDSVRDRYIALCIASSGGEGRRE